MSDDLGYLGPMGPKLLSKVEAQLLEDLRHYSIQVEGPSFDWSDSCVEGHQASHLDGYLENFSNVGVDNADGKCIATGWIEFIHGGDPNKLFVFWDLLEVRYGQRWNRLKNFGGIPQHIWDKLPISSRNLLADTSCDEYDANWCRDPLVIAWRKSIGRLDLLRDKEGGNQSLPKGFQEIATRKGRRSMRWLTRLTTMPKT